VGEESAIVCGGGNRRGLIYRFLVGFRLLFSSTEK
jgi:hypothetical protein